MELILSAAVLRKAGCFLIPFCLTALHSSQTLRDRLRFILKSADVFHFALGGRVEQQARSKQFKELPRGKKQIAQLKLLRQTDCQEEGEEEEGLSAWETERESKREGE